MEFSLNIVEDGQKSVISITGLGEIKEHKKEFVDALTYAIGLAIGLESEKENSFINEEQPLPEMQLPPEERIKSSYEKVEIGKYEKREGTLENIEDIKIKGDKGNKTINADSSHNEENVSSQIKEKDEQPIKFHKRKEQDIILDLFVHCSQNVCKEETTNISLLREELKKVKGI